jgi:predicted transposase/invertase (TIGR01784 family)
MAKKQTQALTTDGPARYIDPRTDFGFKKIFGTEANKFVLREFLQSLLQSKGKITSLRYLNPAQLGINITDRSAIYDIYCETTTGEKFIVEMQRADQDYFKDRSVFYSTFPIQSQATKGKKWDFKLNAVYTIGVLDFVFEADEKNKRKYQYIHHVHLSDTETKDVFYDKLTFVYLELPKFKKKEEDLVTPLDKWMYVLKNLAMLDDRPKALQERVFERLFRIAEIEKLSSEEKFLYREAQKRYWDMNNVIKTAVRKSKQEVTQQVTEQVTQQVTAEKNKIIEELAKTVETERAEKEKILAELAELKSRLKE